MRHDAVAWGYARGGDSRGVDIIQNCEVTGFQIENGKCLGVETTKGFIGATKVGCAVAGSSSRLMSKAEMRLPMESHVLQAFVSEGLKPVLPGVITFGAGHFYCSQSDKGGLVFGGDIDGYNSYAQRGNLPVVEDVCEGGMAILPALGVHACCGCGAGSWTCRWTARPSSTAPISTGSISTAAGATAGSRQRLPPALLCAFAGQRRAAPNRHRLPLRPFRDGHMIDEKGMGNQPNHCTQTCIINHPLARPPRQRRIHLSWRCQPDRPPRLASDTAHGRFHDYGYLRDNPAGWHRELWFHEGGDRSWLVVTRNTSLTRFKRRTCPRCGPRTGAFQMTQNNRLKGGQIDPSQT